MDVVIAAMLRKYMLVGGARDHSDSVGVLPVWWYLNSDSHKTSTLPLSFVPNTCIEFRLVVIDSFGNMTLLCQGEGRV